VLNILQDLQEKFHLTYFFIAHDLAVVRYISSRVAIMSLRRIVEPAETDELFVNPRHPYTEVLVSAVPLPDPDFNTGRIHPEGDISSPINPPPGCNFHQRFRYAQQICMEEPPGYRDIGKTHFVSCHLAESLSLRQIHVS